MVLSRVTGGAGTPGAPRSPGPAPSSASASARRGGRRHLGVRGWSADPERGSQALEAALVLPAIVLLLVLLLHAGLLAVDFVAAQGLAREAARIAAVSDDETTRAALAAAAGGQTVALELDPAGEREPGTLVTAQLELRSRAFLAFGLEAWLPARATMRVEDR